MKELYIIDETNYTGQCPECSFSWDLGEYPDYLMNLEISESEEQPDILDGIELKTPNKDYIREEVEKKARLGGWTPENGLRMSSIIASEKSNGVGYATQKTYHCPNCFAAWESVTGKRHGTYAPLPIWVYENGQMIKKSE